MLSPLCTLVFPVEKLEKYFRFLLLEFLKSLNTSFQNFPPSFQATLPKYTSPMVTKYFKQLTAPYNELVSAFHNSRRPEELGAAAERHAAAFAADGNAGLVEQVRAARTRTDIRLHTNTFLTLSTAELATRCRRSISYKIMCIFQMFLNEQGRAVFCRGGRADGGGNDRGRKHQRQDIAERRYTFQTK